MPPKKYPFASTSVPSVQCSETPKIILPSNPIPEHKTRKSKAPEELCQSLLEAETTATLTKAIMLMTKELRRHENPTCKAKAKEPDTFDGSNLKKLNNFILLCNLYFRSSSTYSNDSPKVNFALSYLQGTALEYFELTLLDSEEVPDWMDDWSAFVWNLCTQFRPIDPTANAEDSIDNLKMQDNQHIVKYNVKFNCLMIRTGWDNGILRHCYYSGLVEHIKDIMGQQGKPTDRTGICLGMDMTISAYYFGIFKIIMHPF